MRKALIGLILAASTMTSAAALAQDWRDRGHGGHERSQNGNEERAARTEQHQQHQQQQVQQPQQQPAQAQAVERRGNWRSSGETRGNWQGNADRANRGNWQGNNGGNWRGNDRGNNQSIYPQAWQGNPNDPQLQHYRELERRNQQRYGNDGRNDRGNWRGDRNGRNDRGDWRGDRNGRTNWNREWRNDRRYDWQGYRYSNRNLFHVGPYYSPYRGYGYNRFSIGIFLDPLFYGRDYWIGDPWEYRLPPAYPGTEWVRYYNDVLLVDVDTGEVVDVIYDFFW